MMGLDAAIPAAGKLAEMDAMWIRQSMSKDGLGDTTVSEAQKRAGMDALGIGESISKIGLDAATSAAETYAARNPFETQEQIKNLEK